MNQNLEIKKVEYSNAPVYEDTESGLNLSEIKNTILRHLPLIAGCTVTLTSLALLKTVVTPPVYLANFEILSEPVNIETRVTSTNDKSRETREQIGSVKLDEEGWIWMGNGATDFINQHMRANQPANGTVTGVVFSLMSHSKHRLITKVSRKLVFTVAHMF